MVFVLFKLFCINGAISFYTVGALTRTHALTIITLTLTRFPSRTTFFGGHTIQPSDTAVLSRGQTAFGLALLFTCLCCGLFHELDLAQAGLSAASQDTNDSSQSPCYREPH